MVIDGHDEQGRRSGEIVIRMWKNGREQKPNRAGFLDVPDLHVKVKTVDDKLVFYDRKTLQPLMDLHRAEEEIAAKDKRIAELEAKLRKKKEE